MKLDEKVEASGKGFSLSSSLNFCGCFLQLHLPFPNHWSQTSRTTSYRFVLHAWNMRTGLVYEYAGQGGSGDAAELLKPHWPKKKNEEERAAKTGKGGAEKSDRMIGLTTRPRKGIYSWRRTQTRVYCLSKLFFRSQWTCRLCEISRGLSLKYSIKRPDEIYTRPASNDRPLESAVSCHVFHIWSKKLEFRSFRLIVRISVSLEHR